MPKKQQSELRKELEGLMRAPLAVGGITPSYLNAAADTEDFASRQAVETAPSILDSAAAAFAGNTDQQFGKAIKDRLFSPAIEPEEGYTPDLEILKQETATGADRDLIEAYSKARSYEEASKLVSDWKEEQERVATVMANGAGAGIALSFAAELPTLSNWIPAVGVAKALAIKRMGSAYLAAQGASAGRVAGSAVLENVLSGTAVEVARQGVTGKYSVEDLGISLLADMTIGLGAAAIDIRRGAKYLDINQAAEQTVMHESDLVMRAKAKLGPDASDEQVLAEVDATRANDVQGLKKEAMADRPTQQDFTGQAEEAPIQKAPEPVTAEFNEPDSLAWREEKFRPGGEFEYALAEHTNGRVKQLADFEQMPRGVNYVGEAIPPEGKPAVDTAIRLANRFLGDMKITIAHRKLTTIGLNGVEVPVHGEIVQVSDNAAMISINPDLTMEQQIRTMVHEMGHAIFNKNIAKIAPDQREGLAAAFRQFLADADAAKTGDVGRASRFSVTHVDQGAGRVDTPKLTSDYERNWDEFSAEQFVKYIDEDIMGDNRFGLHKRVVAFVRAAIHNAIAFLRLSKREHLGVTNEYREFFDTLAQAVETQTPAKGTLSLNKAGVSQANMPALVTTEFLTDPDTARFGLATLPVSTPEERKKAQAILALHKRAAEWEKANPLDKAWIKRANNLADNQVFNVASAGLILLKSKNPLVRMLATELAEDASGVAGKRRATAAISKHIVQDAIMGNVAIDLEGAYSAWAKNRPGGLLDDLVHGNNRAAFNDALTEERAARHRTGRPVSTDPNIKAAADSLDAAYQRSANLQRRAGTLGSTALPASSVGYMPHRMSPAAVFNATNEQRQILHSALVDQFVTIEGWDMTLADKVASAYVTRVHSNASGDWSSPIGGASSATMVREALVSMRLPDAVIEQHMANFTRGAANFTKHRTDLDLNRVYQTAAGEFRLRDVFEKDQLVLLQAQAGRASGEVALAKFGIQGKPGLELLSTAMKYGEDTKRAELREHEAFDQIAAEFMNEPFGSAATKWMERAMQANTAVRLGGIGFNQLAEFINATAHVGVGATLKAVGAMPRLRSEIKALTSGRPVSNPILSSIELVGGAEFGTGAYRVALPFANADRLYPTYGQDTLTMTDRLLRGAGYLQSKLSFWRAIHTTQQRGIAEQVTHKIFRYIREGNDDASLQQFGVNPQMRSVLRAQLGNIAVFDNAGNLSKLDITKLTDEGVREELIQAVWRGTSQIIQGTFIGERGKWVHDGWMRMMTQFRSFPITAMEKQWGRQRNTRGAAKALGILVGSMSLAAPIYTARVYAASLGREDQQEYLDQRLTTQNVMRSTLQYLALSGLAGDFTDALTDSLPDELRKDLGLAQAAGREGVDSRFVGNYVLPASSLIDDAWKAMQSQDAADIMKTLPLRNVPYIVPLINGLKEAVEE